MQHVGVLTLFPTFPKLVKPVLYLGQKHSSQSYHKNISWQFPMNSFDMNENK